MNGVIDSSLVSTRQRPRALRLRTPDRAYVAHVIGTEGLVGFIGFFMVLAAGIVRTLLVRGVKGALTL